MKTDARYFNDTDWQFFCGAEMFADGLDPVIRIETLASADERVLVVDREGFEVHLTTDCDERVFRGEMKCATGEMALWFANNFPLRAEDVEELMKQMTSTFGMEQVEGPDEEMDAIHEAALQANAALLSKLPEDGPDGA